MENRPAEKSARFLQQFSGLEMRSFNPIRTQRKRVKEEKRQVG